MHFLFHWYPSIFSNWFSLCRLTVTSMYRRAFFLPPLIQKVGHHAHEGLRLDLTTFLQLIQVQAELQPLRSKTREKGKNHTVFKKKKWQVLYLISNIIMHLTLYSYTVCTSVARPASPMKSLSPIGKIFWKSVVTSCAWTPNLRSDAIATHSFPRIAMTAPPLYDIIDYGKKVRQQNLFKIKQLNFSIQSE